MTEPSPHSDTGDGPDRELSVGTPRWVKVFGIIAVALVVVLVVLHLTGVSPSGH